MEAVLVYERERKLACPGCGLPRDKTMSKEAQDHFISRPLRCHACAARERAAKRFTAGPHDPAGLFHTIEENGSL